MKIYRQTQHAFGEKAPDQNGLTFDYVESAEKIESKPRIVRIKVVGVGGAGGNAINRMIDEKLSGVDFIAINTDLQVLERNKAPVKLQIGKNLTRGLGSGGDPEVGRRAIEENRDIVEQALSNTDMIFITCGMGGGTGTGASPVVAEIARSTEALTVAIVTLPFEFEGIKRMEKAEQGIYELRQYVDTLIVIPNQKLLSIVEKKTTLESAFRMADEVLLHATKGISDLVTLPGIINLDFADVRAVMAQKGDALMGSAVASGENRAKEAAEKAITSKILEDTSILGATGALLNITGGSDLTLDDVAEASKVVRDAAGPELDLYVGAVYDPSMHDSVRVTVIATGFHRNGYRSNRTGNSAEAKIPSVVPAVEEKPVFEQFDREVLMQVLRGSDFSLEEFSSLSKDNLAIPTFIRRQMV